VTQLAEVFEVKWQGFNLRRGVSVLAVLLVPLIVLAAIGQRQFWLSVSFGVLFVALSDPGGDQLQRVTRMALFALIGALLTVLGFGIGGWAWGLVVLAAFVITLLAGLAVKFGVHRFVMAMLLNVWFVVAITLPGAYHASHIHTNAWAQALAWLTGSALMIVYITVVWLVRGRGAQPQRVAEIPGDISPVKLTRPVIFFALLRAIALSAAVAIAFGLHLPNADWMPVATIVALKPSLQQSALVAEQRVAGTIIGAAVAALFLLAVDSKTALIAVMVVLGALAGAIRTVSYTLYCAAVAGFVLIAMDLPHPTNLAAEGRRVLFTFVGVAIAVVVMLLANLLQKRTAKPAPQAAVHQGPAGAG
jgi:Fusaric acid resistance protein-like